MTVAMRRGYGFGVTESKPSYAPSTPIEQRVWRVSGRGAGSSRRPGRSRGGAWDDRGGRR